MIKERYLKEFIYRDLGQKMVFLAGPRQVGKTTLAKLVLSHTPQGLYFNWDRRNDSLRVLKAEWPSSASLVVIDELHKYRLWKRWIKGEFDKFRDQFRFLITGSARMDVYRRGGDSLQGRYHHYRLHPFSVAELTGHVFNGKILEELFISDEENREVLGDLLSFGGFPEPLFQKNHDSLRRWHHERIDRFIREDVRDLENVQDLTTLEMLAELLISKASGLLSLNSLREDLEVSHKAISHWVQIFERLYYIFRIYPYTSKKIRSLKKESKVYLWDYSMIADEARKFENLVASHLLKFCHFLEDTQGFKAELYYLRDVDKREVDFLVTIDRKPWFAVEAKVSDQQPAPSLHYFGERLNIPFLYQVILMGQQDFRKNKVRVVPAAAFLTHLV